MIPTSIGFIEFTSHLSHSTFYIGQYRHEKSMNSIIWVVIMDIKFAYIADLARFIARLVYLQCNRLMPSTFGFKLSQLGDNLTDSDAGRPIPSRKMAIPSTANR